MDEDSALTILNSNGNMLVKILKEKKKKKKAPHIKLNFSIKKQYLT